MLLRYGIENFKCFGTLQQLELAPITLIYGRNSSGKSSLIQSLLLLKQSFESPTRRVHDMAPKGPLVDLGSFATYVHKHEANRSVRFQLTSTLRQTPPDLTTTTDLEYAVETPGKRKRRRRRRAESSEGFVDHLYGEDGGIDDSSTRSLLKAVTVTLHSAQEGVLARIPLQRDIAKGEDVHIAASGSLFRERNYRVPASAADSLAEQLLSLPFTRAVERLNTQKGFIAGLLEPAIERPATLFSEPQLDRKTLQRALKDLRFQGHPFPGLHRSPFAQDGISSTLRPLADLLKAVAENLEADLASTSFIGPTRATPARLYEAASSENHFVGQQGEMMPFVLASTPGEQLVQLNDWMERLDVPYRLSVKVKDMPPAGEFIVLALRDRRTDIDVTPADVGFGVGQILPILAEGIAGDSMTTCVMQPELHLHPRLQAAMGDFFIGTAFPELAVKLGREDPVRQWIIETHSEALVLRLQRRIREGTLKNDQVCVLYVDEADGGSHVLRLRLDDRGRFLDEWPGGFFEESFRELFPED